MSPAATERANASVIFCSVRSFVLMQEVSAADPDDLEPDPRTRNGPGEPGAVTSRDEGRVYLNRLSMIRMKPGPMMTTKSAGRMHRISGNTILTGVCWALASAA
jgi:hypothetical protein